MAPEKKNQTTRKNQKPNKNHNSGRGINNAKPTTTTNTSSVNTMSTSTVHHQTASVEHQQQTTEHSQQYVAFERSWEQATSNYTHTTSVDAAMLPIERWQNEDVREQTWHGMESAYLNELRIDMTEETVMELEEDGDIDSMVCAASVGTDGV